jgi:hypothetical protein
MALAERDRRALIIFGAVVVVALAAYFLFLKKGGETPAAVQATSGPTSPFTPSPTTAPSPHKTATPRTPPPSELPLAGKDPFSPLVNPSSGGGGGPSTTGPGGTTAPGVTTPSTTTSPSGTSSPTSTGTPTQTPTVSPPASPSSAPGGGTSAHVGGHTVTLLDIFHRDGVDKAQVQVDSTVYTVNEGQTFSDGFKLVAINGTCATFTKAGQEFVLCENPQK